MNGPHECWRRNWKPANQCARRWRQRAASALVESRRRWRRRARRVSMPVFSDGDKSCCGGPSLTLWRCGRSYLRLACGGGEEGAAGDGLGADEALQRIDGLRVAGVRVVGASQVVKGLGTAGGERG